MILSEADRIKINADIFTLGTLHVSHKIVIDLSQHRHDGYHNLSSATPPAIRHAGAAMQPHR
jgi:hypothetical protein